ncbi:MAG TPA: nuclear transport factor 2 family protein [Acidobacteriota bacterium]|nr:nuclear transport factor 2 family protein [Acidobacteriota bacterium]
MRSRIVLGSLALLFLLAGQAWALADGDRQGVETALQHYLQGGAAGDAKRVAKAFHPQAELKYVREGAYSEISLQDYLSRIKEPNDRKARIASIDIMGNAAQAKLELESDDYTIVDYMNLLKIEGEWKIVNKIFHFEPK